MAKPQDSVNIERNGNHRELYKTLGDFRKPLLEINLEKRKRQLKRQILSNLISGFCIPNTHQEPEKSQGKDAWGLAGTQHHLVD